MPFNWKTPFGYSIALIGESLAGLAMIFMGGPSGVYFVGSSTLIIEFVKDITNDMSNLNVPAFNERNRKKMKKRFYNILQDFSDAKQLSKILWIKKLSNFFTIDQKSQYFF